MWPESFDLFKKITFFFFAFPPSIINKEQTDTACGGFDLVFPLQGSNPSYVPWSHGDHFALTLPSVNLSEEGAYTAVVSNEFGETRTSALVTIKEGGVMSETGSDYSDVHGQ